MPYDHRSVGNSGGEARRIWISCAVVVATLFLKGCSSSELQAGFQDQRSIDPAGMGGLPGDSGAAGGGNARAGQGSLASSSGTGGKPVSGTSGTGGAFSSASGTGGWAGAGTFPAAGSSSGGSVSSAYCQGGFPKLSHRGRTFTPGVTPYESLPLSCCRAYGVNLHVPPSRGFDVSIELILMTDIHQVGEYSAGPGSGVRAVVHRGEDLRTSLEETGARGSVRSFGIASETGEPQIGLCLEVIQRSSDLFGTKLYVPKIALQGPRSGKRFQFFLLKDSQIGSRTAASQALEDLVLEEAPILDLNQIAFVEPASGIIGLNPGQSIGDALRARLGKPLGLPFVVVADGERRYLGTFYTNLSSFSPEGPSVQVEAISSNNFRLRPSLNAPDARFTGPILTVLSETGKLLPQTH